MLFLSVDHASEDGHGTSPSVGTDVCITVAYILLLLFHCLCAESRFALSLSSSYCKWWGYYRHEYRL